VLRHPLLRNLGLRDLGLRALREAPSLAVAMLAGGAWYVAATRIMFRLGSEDAANVIGLLTGGVITAALWRRSAADSLHASLERLACPRCGGPLGTAHEHVSVALPGGLQEWTCAACGYAHAEALTCEGCRP
jgi:ribosomal protein S27AE